MAPKKTVSKAAMLRQDKALDKKLGKADTADRAPAKKAAKKSGSKKK